MKRGIILSFIFLASLALVSAENICELNITMLSQDPYPANPGEYVKLVFQVDGVSDNDCGDITFKLIPDYPLSLDPSDRQSKKFERVDYLKDFDSGLQVAYKVRVDRAALDGANPIQVSVQNNKDTIITKEFDLEVQNTFADFEVHVKDMDYSTNEMTLEILNIEDSDVEALSIEIPKQETISVKGPNKVIVGDLDSNDYTTADFEAFPNDGAFNIVITYSDSNSLRRSIEKTVQFDSAYFMNRKADEKTTSKGTYYFWGFIALLVVWMIYKKITKSRKKRA